MRILIQNGVCSDDVHDNSHGIYSQHLILIKSHHSIKKIHKINRAFLAMGIRSVKMAHVPRTS